MCNLKYWYAHELICYHTDENIMFRCLENDKTHNYCWLGSEVVLFMTHKCIVNPGKSKRIESKRQVIWMYRMWLRLMIKSTCSDICCAPISTDPCAILFHDKIYKRTDGIPILNLSYNIKNLIVPVNQFNYIDNQFDKNSCLIPLDLKVTCMLGSQKLSIHTGKPLI